MVLLHIPSSRLTHPVNNPVKDCLPTLFQSFAKTLEALFVGRELEKAGDEMVEGELAVFFRSMLEDCIAVRTLHRQKMIWEV